MKKIIDVLLIAAMLAASVPAMAESGSVPPEPPQMEQGRPPEPPDGTHPGAPPDGTFPGDPLDGSDGSAPGRPMGGPPGGMSSRPESYSAVITCAEDTEFTDETIASTGTDENAVLVTAGNVTVSGGDSASFYGVGAAVLVTGGAVTVEDTVISTSANGGAGVFAYGDGTAYVSDTEITTQKGASGGIHVAGGGTLKAVDLTVSTYGASSAAIRSDRGSGTMTVEGGSYTSHGSGSPAVYVTADISVKDAELTATGSEALCLEGLNTIRLYDCDLSGDMPDDAQNDNTWTVILYQSMSGDSQVGRGTFVMDGGTLTSGNGGIFYTTNTDSVFTVRNVEIAAADDCEYFLRVTGNSNRRGWGTAGQNGANCVFTAIAQEMNGDVIYDSVSCLTLYLTEGTVFTGALVDDESCAGSGGSGTVSLIVDAASAWVVTADSSLTSLNCAGRVVDAEGLQVRIVGTDGTVFVEGESGVTVTVASYGTEADTSAAGQIKDWSVYDIL